MASRARPDRREVRLKNGVIIGMLVGKVFKKRVKQSRHLYHKVGDNGSWGMDYDILFNELPEDGSVYIHDIELGVLYMVKNRVWREKGIIMHFKQDTKDHYTQVFLPVEYFDKVKSS